jgi:hypothetical protein
LPVLPKIAEIAVRLPLLGFSILAIFGNYQILAIADIKLLSSRD